jgi:hypothetical protein
VHRAFLPAARFAPMRHLFPSILDAVAAWRWV